MRTQSERKRDTQATSNHAAEVAPRIPSSAPPTPVSITNNVFYSQSPSSRVFIQTNTGGQGYTQSNNIINTSNPNMANAPATVPASPDFRLIAGSIAIDFGVNLETVGLVTDFEGNRRPQGSSHDAGSYEVGGQSGPAPSPPKGLRVF